MSCELWQLGGDIEVLEMVDLLFKWQDLHTVKSFHGRRDDLEP